MEEMGWPGRCRNKAVEGYRSPGRYRVDRGVDSPGFEPFLVLADISGTLGYMQSFDESHPSWSPNL